MTPKLTEIDRKVTILTKDFESLRIEFDKRGRNHDINNQRFSELADDNNKLSKHNDSLREELNLIKTEQAVHKTIINQFSEITKDLKSEFRNFGDKIVSEMEAIKISLANANTKETTQQSMVRLLFSLIANACTVVACVWGAAKALHLI